MFSIFTVLNLFPPKAFGTTSTKHMYVYATIYVHFYWYFAIEYVFPYWNLQKYFRKFY